MYEIISFLRKITSFSFYFANPFVSHTLPRYWIHGILSFGTKGQRSRCHGNSIRGPPTLNAILAPKDRLRRKSRRTKGDEDAEGAGSRYRPWNSRRKGTISLREELFKIESLHPSASLSTLPVSIFLAFPLFSFFLSPFLFSTRVHMYRRETFGNFWRNGSFNSLPSFYASTWITRANVHCTCELWMLKIGKKAEFRAKM